MSELSLKSLTAKIVSGVIATLIVSGVTWWIKEQWFSKEPLSKAVKIGVMGTLSAYCKDINQRTFDAHRYFTRNVERFYQMQSTTPGKINKYVNGQFYEQFRNPTMTFDESTLTLISSNEIEHFISVIMYSDYFNVAENKQYKKHRSRCDIRFDKYFKIIYWRQYLE